MEYVAPGARSGRERDEALRQLFIKREENDPLLPIPLCCFPYNPKRVSYSALFIGVLSQLTCIS